MSIDPVDDQLGVTGNAILLLGYIAGAVTKDADGPYEVVDVDAAGGSQLLRRKGADNLYRVNIVQIGGAR